MAQHTPSRQRCSAGRELALPFHSCRRKESQPGRHQLPVWSWHDIASSDKTCLGSGEFVPKWCPPATQRCPFALTSALGVRAALTLCRRGLSLGKQPGEHRLLLKGTEKWEGRRWMAFLKCGKRNILSWLPWKLRMDNKHLEVLSFPLAPVAHNLCEEEHYHAQGGWQIPEWGKMCERICSRADRDSRETALPEVLPKNGNGAPWKEGLYGHRRGKHLGRMDLAQGTPCNPGNIPFWDSCYCQPCFGTFPWSYTSLVQPGISFTAIMFVCFLTVVFGILFNTSCMTFLTQINFGAVDWKRSCRSSSTPKWQIMPTHHQYIKEEDISLVTMHS